MQKYRYDILFIEDEVDVRKNYVHYLKRYFENVYEVGTLKEAHKLYKEKRPSILIVDINLPDGTGIEFLAKIRESDHTVRAIMLTAMSSVEILLDATELKLTKYLIKPVCREGLREALENAVEELHSFTTYSNNKILLKDSFYWDKNTKQLFKDNIEQMLTNKERALLTLLFSDIKQTFTTEDIIFELWYDVDSSKVASLKTIIKKLRKKLPDGTIKNVFGVGYKIEE